MQRRKRPPRHRCHTDQAGRDERPVCDVFGRQQFDRPSGTQQQAGTDDQAAFAGFIPALAPVGRVVVDVAGRAMTILAVDRGGGDVCHRVGRSDVVVTDMVGVIRSSVAIVFPGVQRTGHDERLGLFGLGGPDAKAQLRHRRLDLVARRGARLQLQRQLFRHDRYVDVADPRKPLYSRPDLDGTRRAIHPGDDPLLRFGL